MRGSFKTFARLLLGLTLLAILGAAEARAGFTISVASLSGSGPYTVNYTAAITTDDRIETGNFFRIYDFFGYVTGSIAAPAGWTATTELLTPTPPPNVILTQGDDPNVANLIFTYVGSTPIAGPVEISGFRADTIFPALTNLKDFAGRATQATGATAGQAVDSVGNVRVPGVPEPAAVVSLTIGLAGLGWSLARRKSVRAS